MPKQETKSIIVGRMPRVNGNEFKTLFIKMFSCDSAISCDDFPDQEISIENVEKVVFVDCIPEYYLEGNDLCFDNISEVSWEQKGTTVEISVTKA